MSMLIELHYLPNITYFHHLMQHDEVIIEAHETFQKQTYRNRAKILTSNKVDTLVIPVDGLSRKVGSIKEVKIDWSQRWQLNHWRAITSAYGKAPFFEYYVDYLHASYHKHYEYLYDFNIEILHSLCKALQINCKIIESNEYIKKDENNLLINDMRDQIHPKNDKYFSTKAYFQVFGEQFVDNLSILDILFCTGPEAKVLLKNK